MPEITTRDAVTRAMAAMEIAETCPDPTIRNSFTALAGDWLDQAEEAARSASQDDRRMPEQARA